MRLTGLHFLLTYRCTRECDHCFVWGSPHQRASLSLSQIDVVLRQAKEIGTITSIYFEGGEPFLYYLTLLKVARLAATLGFSVGIVSNAYWATSQARALNRLRPFAGLLDDLSISNDGYHGKRVEQAHVLNARAAADQLGIPTGEIAIAQPEAGGTDDTIGQLAQGESAVMYRGRAALKLAARATHRQSWAQFDACPHENLRDPGRVHIDPFGYLHICHGITLGNVFETPLREICERYDADAHPITGPLLRGGPAALARDYAVPHAETYADACHLCDETRRLLRPRFPDTLTPDPVYGVFEPPRRWPSIDKRHSPV